MSTDRDTTRIVRSWLEEGATALPDRVLDAVLDQVPATSQRRPVWPAWRFHSMNNTPKLGLAAAAVAVVVLAGIALSPRNGGLVGTGPDPIATPTGSQTPTPTVAPTPTASPAALSGFREGRLTAGTYTIAPFTSGDDECKDPPRPGCIEPASAGRSLRFTVTIPAGWTGVEHTGLYTGTTDADTAGMVIGRGGWLLSDPCQTADADIRVGPTVADFVDAVAAHPILDTTAPVDVTLAGYRGKYFDLQGPAVVSSDVSPDPKCPDYRPWNPGIYMQGPNNRWHVWVLDVGGARVVIQGTDTPGTSDAHRAELQAIVDSMKIE